MAPRREHVRWLGFLRAILVVCLVVGSAASLPLVSVAMQEESPDVWIADDGVSRSGDSIVRNSTVSADNSTFIWRDGKHVVNTTITSTTTQRYTVCLSLYEDGTKGEEIACSSSKKVENGSSASIPMNVSNAKIAGGDSSDSVSQQVAVEVYPSLINTDVPSDTTIRNYTVITRDGDLDDDGLTNEREVNENLNFTNSDMDADGLRDGEELRTYNTSPTDNDTDGDGILDAAEIRSGTDPLDASEPSNSTDTEQQSEEDITPDPSDPATLTIVLIGLLGIGSIGGVLIWQYKDGDENLQSVGNDLGTGTESESEFIGPRRSDDGPASNAPTGDAHPRDELLLTDADRVYNLVCENNGRMKQKNIVAETEWSKSKVSRVLSSMEADGEINKLRVGRGNVVYVDGAEPEAARSPYEDDES